MLNRTNRTLSANTNRLNLGTRSFTLAANVANGKSTLRARFQDGDSPRVGMPGSHDPYPEIHPTGIGIPGIPSSSPDLERWPASGGASEARVVGPVVRHRVVVRPAACAVGARASVPPVAQPECPAPVAAGGVAAGPGRKAARRILPASTGMFVKGRMRTRVRPTMPVAAIVAATGG